MESNLSKIVGRATLAAALAISLLCLGSCAGGAKPEAEAPAPSAPKKLDLAALIGAKDLGGIKDFFGNRELLDKADAEGSYPLHRAVEQDAPEIVELLLALGAKPDPVDAKGRTPLRLAVERNSAGSAKVLVERGASLFSKDSSGTSVAQAVLSKGGSEGGAGLFKAVFTEKSLGQRDPEGSTVLHLAADSLLEDSARGLLDAGADPAAKNSSGHSALDMALLHPDRIESARIAELLILRGSTTSFPDFAWFVQAVKSMNYGSLRYEDGNTPLHEAVSRRQKGFVAFLLSRKVNPNIRNGAGSAPLHEAVRSGWLEGASLLLEGGADANVRDGFDNTPLHIALPEAGREEGIALLLKHGADPALKDRNGNIPLHIAVEIGYPVSLVETLLAAGSPVNAANAAGDTALHIALRSGRLEYAPPLLKAGADIFLANGKGESPLAVAIAAAGGVSAATGAPSGLDDGCAALGAVVNEATVSGRDNLGNGPLAIAVSLRAPTAAIGLIASKGADVNARNNSGDTPLSIAVRRNFREQGEALLAAKADIFASNVKGETPLSIALGSPKGPIEWLFNSATVGARDANGDTPLHHAARLNLPAAIDFLVQKGADLNARNGDGSAPLASAVKADSSAAVRALMAKGADLEGRDAMGDTALHDAILWGAKASLPLLVEAGAKPNARNSGGETALHLAVRKGDLESIRYLSGRGASLELRDNRGATPLFVAAKTGATDIAAFLLSAGADVEARDQSGRVPLAAAVDAGDAATARLLVSSGASIVALDASGSSPLSIAAARSLSLLDLLLGPSTVNKADSEGRAPLRLLVDLKAAPEALDLALSKGALPDARDRYSDTALLAALRAGRLDAAGKLAQAGADLFASNKDGDSPASLAVSQGAEALKALLGTERVNAADPAGDRLLHYAARAGKAEAAAWLLAAGADKTARNLLGETAADLAAKRGYADLAASLK